MGVTVLEAVCPIAQTPLVDLLAAGASTVSAGGTLVPVVARLFSAAVTPNPANPDPAQFTEADFSGYGDVTVTLTAAAPLANNAARLVFDSAAFAVGAATPQVTNQIYGVWLGNVANDKWFGAKVFPQPVSLAAVGDLLVVVPELAATGG